MTADVDICNRAILQMGGRTNTIASLNEGSKEANACNVVYGPLRDRLQRSAPWNFTRATGVLNLLKAAAGTPENPVAATVWSTAFPALPWAYAYYLPPDCLRVRAILPQSSLLGANGIPLTTGGVLFPGWMGFNGQRRSARFEVAADVDASNNPVNVINTGVQAAIACYTRRVTLPDLWDPTFEETMVAMLAAVLTIPLSGDKQLARMNADNAKELIVEARVTAANEGVAEHTHVPDWIKARGGYGYGMADQPMILWDGFSYGGWSF